MNVDASFVNLNVACSIAWAMGCTETMKEDWLMVLISSSMLSIHEVQSSKNIKYKHLLSNLNLRSKAEITVLVYKLLHTYTYVAISRIVRQVCCSLQLAQIISSKSLYNR